MGTVETFIDVEPAQRRGYFAAEWVFVTTALPPINARRRILMMKKLCLAAMAACAFAAFACVPQSACVSRKTGFSEFEEFMDLTSQRNQMDCRTITDPRSLGNTCYIGRFSLDTEQVTVQSAPTRKSQSEVSLFASQFSNSTIGTDDRSRLKARLA